MTPSGATDPRILNLLRLASIPPFAQSLLSSLWLCVSLVCDIASPPPVATLCQSMSFRIHVITEPLLYESL